MSKPGRIGGVTLGLTLCVLVAAVQTAGSAPTPAPAGSSAPQAQAIVTAPSQPATPVPGSPPENSRATKDQKANLMPLAAYVALLILFVTLLHLVDSLQAYGIVRRDSRELWKRLPDKLSADESLRVMERLAISESPAGMAGTTRSILAYALLIVLGIATFHLLMVSSDSGAAKSADNLLTLLAGSLTTAIGFYFGTKATTEGVTAGRPQQETGMPAKPGGRIEKVEPAHAAAKASVIIQGTGFGKEQGNVQFGESTGAKIENWSEVAIRVIVPEGLLPGKINVFVNPAHGSKIIGEALFVVDS